jgi:DNA-binding CsgD family transcriptional regulator
MRLAVQRGQAMIERLPRGCHRAAVLAALADTEALSLKDAVEMASDAVEEAGDDMSVRARFLLVLANAHINANDFRAALRSATEALSAVEHTEIHDLRMHAVALTGELEIHALNTQGWRRLRTALELDGSEAIPDPYLSPAGRLGACLLWADNVGEARSLLERQYWLSEAIGDEYSRGALCQLLVELECRAGDVRAAGAYAQEEMLIAERAGSERGLAAGCASIALVAALAGDGETATEYGLRAIAITDRLADVLYGIRSRGALAALEISRGNYQAALNYLDRSEETFEEIGMLEPGCIPIHIDALEARVLVGDFGDAQASVDRWSDLGHRLRRPSILASAYRARGLLVGRSENHRDAVSYFERALELSSDVELPIERARTLLAAGVAYRRMKQRSRARAALLDALHIFQRTPAMLWAARTQAELARIGGRTASRDQLTPSEAKVAQLVAQGYSNREVAESLFITVRTVESNLTRIYRKLNVRSRAQLAHAYAAQLGE